MPIPLTGPSGRPYGRIPTAGPVRFVAHLAASHTTTERLRGTLEKFVDATMRGQIIISTAAKRVYPIDLLTSSTHLSNRFAK